MTAAVTSDEALARYPGWRVVAFCFALAVFAWGFCFYGHGLYLAALQRQHGWPTSVIAGATTAFYLSSALLSAFVGDAIARFGVRTVVISGISLIAVAAALLPLLTAPWQLYLAYGVMAFGWAGTSLTAITTILGTWFSHKRGLAISIGLTGASFGGILVVPLLAFGSERWGFAPALWTVASIVGAVLALAALLCLRAPPPFAGRRGAGGEAAETRTRAQLLRDPAFWSVSAPFALGYVAQVGFLVHEIALLEPTVGRATAGLAVALTTGAAVGGRLVLGAVVDRLDQRLVTGVSFFSQAVALLAIFVLREPWALVVACAVFGFSVGNVITLPALIIGREFGLAEFATVVGLSNAVCQVVFSFGPTVLGLLRDLSGSYGLPLLLCAALDVGAGVAISVPWWNRRRVTRLG